MNACFAFLGYQTGVELGFRNCDGAGELAPHPRLLELPIRTLSRSTASTYAFSSDVVRTGSRNFF